MNTVIYSKYSNERNPRLAVRTDILEDEEKRRCVRKYPEFPQGAEHVESIYRRYESFSRLLEGSCLRYNRCERIHGGVELEYLEGETLEEHLLAVKKHQGTEACVKELLEFLHFVKELHVGEEFHKTEAFMQVFGDVNLCEGTECAACTNIDLICGNIVITGEFLTAIDYEWSFDFPIPVKYLLFRIIFYFSDHAGRGTEFESFDLYGKMGITRDEIRVFEAMETSFQQYVCKNHTPVRDLYDDISDGVFEVKDNFTKENLQIYFDFGEGFSEKNSKLFALKHEKIRIWIDLPPGVKALRLDPGNLAGMAELRELRFDNQVKRAAFSLREGVAADKWLYMGESDPNMILEDIPEGAKSLLVDLRLIPVDKNTMAGMKRLMKKYLKQKKTLNEMQNTKVWKLYRKYREYREK